MKIQKLLVLATVALGLGAAMSAPVVAQNAAGAKHIGLGKELGLSKAQKAQLKAIRQASKAQVETVKANTTLAKPDRKARIKAIHEDEISKINALLTPSQQQQYAQIRAEKKAEKRAAKGKA